MVTHASADLVAHMQTAGSKTVLSLAIYSPVRGYMQYCSEENTVGYQSGTAKLDAVGWATSRRLGAPLKYPNFLPSLVAVETSPL